MPLETQWSAQDRSQVRSEDRCATEAKDRCDPSLPLFVIIYGEWPDEETGKPRSRSFR
jgi:hypothetical protein